MVANFTALGRLPMPHRRGFVLQSVPAPFLGGKEFVYQAYNYVCAFFTSASEAVNGLKYYPAWEVQVERCAGISRLDLIPERMEDDTGVIQEHKREKLTKKDKRDGYDDSQSKRLTKMAAEGLQQLETKQYRASMRDHVTKLHEYSLGFLGPYCAMAGRLLRREPGGQWVIVDSYDADQDSGREAARFVVPLKIQLIQFIASVCPFSWASRRANNDILNLGDAASADIFHVLIQDPLLA